MTNISLDAIHIKAIDRLREEHSPHKVHISEGTEKVIRIDAMGDSQMDGISVQASLFIIDGKIYQRVKDDWEKKKE